MGEVGRHDGERLAMQIGIFAKTFPRPALDEVLDAVASSGLRVLQFNLSCAGLPSLPEQLNIAQCDMVRAALAARGLTMAAISGTFNTAHPDAATRRDGLRRLRVLAENCQSLGTSIITLCSGTRDSQNMWRFHPDNSTPAAWQVMRETMHEAARIGEEFQVTMAFEPEVSNVVDSAKQARRLLDEVGSRCLKVVLDGANLFHSGELSRQDEILQEACELLRSDIVLAHAKDLARDGEAGHQAAGTGQLHYDCYLRNLRTAGFVGPLILHGLREDQVPASIAFLRGKLDQLGETNC
jgi:sugar phosphate isomerase/epimerase